MGYRVMKGAQSIAQRSTVSAIWNIVASLASVSVLFVRSVLLARLLPVEAFGIYALAGAVVTLSVVVPTFGMGGAFLHRAPEARNEEQAARVHFTLNLIFTLAWAVLMIVSACIFTTGQTRTALVVLTITTGGVHFAMTPRLILIRRVVHRRLAIVRILNVLLTTLVSLCLAFQGITLWSLMAVDLVTLTLTVIALYLWRPVWRPHLAWSTSIIRYFLSFGSRNFLADLLQNALERLDNLWVGLYLGKAPLGFYSRAYTFATYPRIILASPINEVARGTYAELKGDHLGLSRAFLHTNSFLVRSGFFVAGLLALVAPEFIRIILGAKWLPMLDAFRLMLIFTLLDPIKATLASLFVAVGEPAQVVKTRSVQLAVLVISLFTLGSRWGIEGVALSMNVMLVIGISLLLWQARAHVTFSVTRMFAVPAFALLIAITAGHYATTIPGVLGSDWHTGAIKIVAFSVLYIGTILLLERDQVSILFDIFRQLRQGNSTIG